MPDEYTGHIPLIDATLTAEERKLLAGYRVAGDEVKKLVFEGLLNTNGDMSVGGKSE